MATLNVFWDSSLVGFLTKVGNEETNFQYAESYLASENAQKISQSMPLQEAAFMGSIPKSWFANLLPEGDIRRHVAAKLGVSERNDFAILKGIGGDCAGALQLLSEQQSKNKEIQIIPLPWDKLEAQIASIPRPSLLAMVLQDGEPRLSLAGAQDKLPVIYSEGELALPGGGAASTHLLKISSGSFPDLVQNELFCLTLAREVGLMVPFAEMAPTATPILLVTRYDRHKEDDGMITRLHQEDFCQALGFPAETKYENEGGPSLARIFDVLARGSHSPLPDKRRLLNWVLFNFIIGNADAHAKNISFLMGKMDDTDDNSGTHLAPFYDLVCTEIYEGISTNMAQKIGGEYRPRNTHRRHWERFAKSIEINSKYLGKVGLELCLKIEDKAPALAAEIGGNYRCAQTLEKIAAVVRKRIRLVRAALNQPPGIKQSHPG